MDLKKLKKIKGLFEEGYYNYPPRRVAGFYKRGRIRRSPGKYH